MHVLIQWLERRAADIKACIWKRQDSSLHHRPGHSTWADWFPISSVSLITACLEGCNGSNISPLYTRTATLCFKSMVFQEDVCLFACAYSTSSFSHMVTFRGNDVPNMSACLQDRKRLCILPLIQDPMFISCQQSFTVANLAEPEWRENTDSRNSDKEKSLTTMQMLQNFIIP